MVRFSIDARRVCQSHKSIQCYVTAHAAQNLSEPLGVQVTKLSSSSSYTSARSQSTKFSSATASLHLRWVGLHSFCLFKRRSASQSHHYRYKRKDFWCLPQQQLQSLQSSLPNSGLQSQNQLRSDRKKHCQLSSLLRLYHKIRSKSDNAVGMIRV